MDRELVSEVRREPSSFRDPAATVFYSGQRVLRGLDQQAARDWERLVSSPFFTAALESGDVVDTRELQREEIPSDAPGGFVTVLEHERIPVVSYPYEWTFSMLRDAALLHLQLLLDALSEGTTMKDGYAFNMQWRGVHPTFIDISSFERVKAGPWIGYRQFCQTFLYPLLLEAHLGVPFQRYLLGHLNGLEPSDMRRFFPGRRRFKRGVFTHVYLQSVAEKHVTGGGQKLTEDLGKEGFGKELTAASVRKLHKLITKLHSKRADSGWKAYRETCSYSDDDRVAKQEFVTMVVDRVRPSLTWDLGSNDGAYARLAAAQGGYVVAVDSDDVTVDAMYRALNEEGVTNVLPLVLDLMDPSPARGWRNDERLAFSDRSSPDLVFGLALIHHLAIASNVPLLQIVDWLRSLDAPVVVEFVEPHDPMAKRLLANKPKGMFADYRIDEFSRLLESRFDILERRALPSGTRTLYLATPR
ncbi:MAG TPA: methyltransferase [Acidimicrobiia bacterium]